MNLQTNLQANDLPAKTLVTEPAIQDANLFLQKVFETNEDFTIPTVKLITPEIAQKILERNRKNRPLKKNHVKWLASQMEAGVWQFTGDSIKFSEDGLLCDKQHTLHAIIESGRPQYFSIICGLKNPVFDVLDTGVGRSAGDVLFANSFHNANRLAAICKSVLLFKANRKGNVLGTGGVKELLSDGTTITNTRIHKEILSNPLYLTASQEASKYYANFRGLTCSQYGTFYFLFSEKNPNDAEEFLSKLAYGVGLSEESPIYLLRKRLEQISMTNIKYSAQIKLYWIIMCWNKFRKGESMKILQTPPNIVIPEII